MSLRSERARTQLSKYGGGGGCPRPSGWKTALEESRRGSTCILILHAGTQRRPFPRPLRSGASLQLPETIHPRTYLAPCAKAIKRYCNIS